MSNCSAISLLDELDFFSASSLKQQFTGRLVTPLGRFILV